MVETTYYHVLFSGTLIHWLSVTYFKMSIFSLLWAPLSPASTRAIMVSRHAHPRPLQNKSHTAAPHLIEMLRVDLPKAAGGRLAEWAGPAQTGSGAGVGPGPVSWRDLESWGRGRTAGGPAELRGRDLAQSLLGRCWNRAGIHGLTGDLGVVEVFFSLGLIGHIAACVRVCV